MFWRMPILHIPVRFQLNRIKTLGQVQQYVLIRSKNANDLHDLDFDPITLTQLWNVTLVYTYLPCQFGEDPTSLRVTNCYIKI